MAEIKTTGTAGLETQIPGQAGTVSAAGAATGGLGAGNFIESDLDEELFRFKSDDTPLMQLMLKAKKVKVKSPEVDHYMIDEPRSSVTMADTLNATVQMQQVLPLDASDQALPRPYTTLLCEGTSGYDENGRDRTPGKPLMLFVTGIDPATGKPIVRTVNGPKGSATDEYSGFPVIAKGTRLTILSNALYETQKQVDPDLIVPQATKVYLQKRGMNQIVSDYFESQKKRIPFGKAVIAEAAITNFKVRGNRTLYAGRKGKFSVNVPNMGTQLIYCTEGVRWQVKREVQHAGRWTIEEIIALAKMVFTGEDVPKSVICLAGKNFLENIQSIDYSKHPEIQISSKTNPMGWIVTNFHTVFGDIDFKHDPTLDRLNWSNSALLVAPDRLVHYQYSAEHTSVDRVEGEEATREALLVWDALALKGSCHVWIDGEGKSGANAHTYKLWGSPEAPQNVREQEIYYLVCDCPGIDKTARAGQLWQARVRLGSDMVKTIVWEQYTEELFA